MKHKIKVARYVLPVILLCLPAGVAAEGTREVLSGIEHELSTSPAIGAHDVSVTYRNNMILFEGWVSDESAKAELDRIAHRYDSDAYVNNNVEVRNIGRARIDSITRVEGRSDTELQSDINQALHEAGLSMENLAISVNDNVVDISGDRESFEEVDQILSIILNVPGVEDIRSEVMVNNNPYPLGRFER